LSHIDLNVLNAKKLARKGMCAGDFENVLLRK